ncbi:uncharacterized protein E1O_06030 [Burkholderiales bacterium GJ-E10]|nr:uncharacterized protein E1O_06030 [Burkholderiales bacterium GJ-E10]
MATTPNFLLAWARRPVAWLLAAVLPLLGAVTLSSCGGGAVALAALGGVGTGGTGLTIGTVVAFGSVGVDGQEYDSETPKYYQNSDASQVAATAVGLGDRMRVETSGGSPVAMTVEPSLIGTVQSISPNADGITGTFLVNGVTVQTNFDATKGPITFYVGLTKFADLTAGMPVEVHGLLGIDPNGNGYIQATRIVQLPASNAASQITGIVQNLSSNETGPYFTIQGSGTTVQLTASTSLLTAGVSLANGQVVNVSSTQPSGGGTITAATVRIHSLVGVSGTAQVEGLLEANGTGGYAVDGIPVDLSASGLLGASGLSAWTPGDALVVTGQVDAAGTLHATTVRAYADPNTAAQVSLKGTITGYVNNTNFLVRGVLVNIPSGVGPSTPPLGNGVYVEITGNPGGVTGGIGQGDQVIATAVAASTVPPSGATVDYLGTVSNYSSVGGTFVLTAGNGTTYPSGSTMSVTLTSNVAYVNGNASNLTTSGTPVEVEGTYSNGSLTVYSVTFLGSAPSSSESEIQGVVTGLSSGNFSVNGVALTWTSGTTTFCHDCNDTPTTTVPSWFANGANVSVNYTNGGSNPASTISLEN